MTDSPTSDTPVDATPSGEAAPAPSEPGESVPQAPEIAQEIAQESDPVEIEPAEIEPVEIDPVEAERVRAELAEAELAEAKAKVAKKRADQAEARAQEEADAAARAEAKLERAQIEADKAEVRAAQAEARAEAIASAATTYEADADVAVERVEQLDPALVAATTARSSPEAGDPTTSTNDSTGMASPDTLDTGTGLAGEAEAPTDSSESTESTAPATQTDPVKPKGWRQRVHDWSQERTGMNPEDRLRVMEAVGIHRAGGWAVHFTLMMLLSVVVAAMGLSANSAAVVIGAMLLAPLMTPVMGAAASLSMADGRQLFRSLMVLVLATAGAIALSFVVARLLPGGELTSEILARTRPDVRDLFVALAAGAAGAYAISQPNLSGSLPGVAIAVALVPPLAAVGITLEAGETVLARGAMLLYVTNLVAIVALGFVVFLATGFAPPWQLARNSPKVLLGGGLAILGTIIVAIPLVLTSVQASSDSQEREDVNAAIEAWLEGTGNDLREVDISGDSVTVSIVGTQQPRTKGALQENIRAIRERPDTIVEVQWAQAYETPDSDDLTEEEQAELEARQQEIAADERDATTRRVIDEWWEASNSTDYRITELRQDAETLVVDIASSVAPPAVRDLAQRLQAVDLTPRVEVLWTQQNRVIDVEPEGDDDSADDTITLIEDVARELQTEANRWAASRPNILSATVVFDGVTVVVDIIAQQAPTVTALRRDLTAALSEYEDDGIADAQVDIFFTPRRLLQPTTTVAPTTTTTTADGTTLPSNDEIGDN